MNRRQAAALILGVVTAAGIGIYTFRQPLGLTGGRQRPLAPPGMTPIHVNVIADGFSSSSPSDLFELDKFKRKLAKIADDDPFKELPDNAFEMEVQPLPASSGVSVLGITVQSTPCYFTYSGAFETNLKKAKQLFAVPDARITIVLVNSAINGACTPQKGLIVTTPRPDVDGIVHELGHDLAGLKHESVIPNHPFTAVVGKIHQEPNCSEDPGGSVGWRITDSNGNAIAPTPGCEDFSSGLCSPTPKCRMRLPSDPYCCVCAEHILRQVHTLLNMEHAPLDPRCTVVPALPSQPVSLVQSGRFVTADFSADGKGIFVEGPLVTIDRPPPLIDGDYFAVLVSPENKVVAAASLPDDPRMARGYIGKGLLDIPVATPLPPHLTLFVNGTHLLERPLTTKVIRLPGKAGVQFLDQQALNELTIALH